MSNGKKTQPKEEFVPSEEQILKELKQKEQRKTYMASDKATTKRKAYQLKKQVERKAINARIKELQETNPAKYAELMKRAGLS